MENLQIFLQNFQSAGPGPYEKIDYISPSHEVFRGAASRDNYLHSLAISVKDENGNLFDFEGLPLEFEIEIK